MNKRGDNLNKVIVHIILIGIIFAIFFVSNAEKINNRGVKQQILEKQMALLIDSAIPGMKFEIAKISPYGYIDDVLIKGGNIYFSIDGFVSFRGYPFFTPYSVSVKNIGNKFLIEIK